MDNQTSVPALNKLFAAAFLAIMVGIVAVVAVQHDAVVAAPHLHQAAIASMIVFMIAKMVKPLVATITE